MGVLAYRGKGRQLEDTIVLAGQKNVVVVVVVVVGRCVIATRFVFLFTSFRKGTVIGGLRWTRRRRKPLLGIRIRGAPLVLIISFSAFALMAAGGWQSFDKPGLFLLLMQSGRFMVWGEGAQ